MAAPKRKSKAQIRALGQRLRRKGLRIVFTNGCFDIIHPGHIRTLQTARALGDRLVVGLNSDRSVRQLKGPGRPLVPQKGRAQVLEALECVDYVVIFNSETPESLIQAVRPHILVKGADWSKGHIVGEEFVKRNGGKVRRIPLVKGFSTTRLFRLLNSKKRGRA